MKPIQFLPALLVTLLVATALIFVSYRPAVSDEPKTPRKVSRTEAEWKKILSPEQFYVLRQKGTERAGTSPLVDNHEKGTYHCAGCKTPLFSSKAKFESGTGWPSFFEPISKEAVEEHQDRAYGMIRTEILCRTCGGHLGHVFDDGPKPTGLRYCMNGVALQFEKK